MKQISRLPDAELEVMQALWAVPKYPARTSDLAARLDRDWKAPTLLKLLSRLEERGFVRGREGGAVQRLHPSGEPAGLSGCGEPILPGAGPRRFPVQPDGCPVPEKELSREDIAELERILEKGENEVLEQLTALLAASLGGGAAILVLLTLGPC